MIDGGASPAFFRWLVDEGYMTSAGEYWLSGYELFNVYEAGIITKLLDPWRQIAPPIDWRD